MQKRIVFVSFITVSTVFLICLSFVQNSAINRSENKFSSKNQVSKEVWVKEQLQKLSTKEKIAQSFMLACWSNKGKSHIESLQSTIKNDKIGGIIFFQGEESNLKETQQLFQASASTPLLFGMDAEWGTAMRLYKKDRFPYPQTVGAANNEEITTNLGAEMGAECREMGIHLSFSPVADVNLTNDNPVIGFRAFGSQASEVSKLVKAFVLGMESNNVLSCVKHFPGHGDTDKDSHFELPTVNHSLNDFRTKDFLPFKAGIDAKTSAVMVAHLNVPALDSSGAPSSLSSKVIQEYLRKELKFKGLVISDALNMKAVSDKYGKTDVVVKAYKAGCDILLFPESVTEAIFAIEKEQKAGTISLNFINEACKRILEAKYKALYEKSEYVSTKNKRQLVMQQVCEKAITVLKNDNNALPLNDLSKSVTHISIGQSAYPAQKQLLRYVSPTQLNYYTPEEAVSRWKTKKPAKTEIVIIDLHANSQRSKYNYGIGNWTSMLSEFSEDQTVIVNVFGNALGLEALQQMPTKVDALVLAHENLSLMQERTIDFEMGCFDVNGKLNLEINGFLKKGMGISVKGNGRLKYTVPEEIGVSSEKLNEIDQIVANAIKNKALPGCQVVVAMEGKVIYDKAFGSTMYENGDSVTSEHIYDLASITKVASSTVSLMKLQGEGKFDTQKTLNELVPEWVENTPYANLKAIDLLTHQAGLTPWIPFYKKTLINGNLDESIYSSTEKTGFTKKVATGIYIQDEYFKTILKTITSTPFTGSKKYEYSDLSYYFFNQFIAKTAKKGQDEYVIEQIYSPLGLRTMGYNPLSRFPKNRIVPTENDKEFRKQVVQGYVHDPGAAMMGGVAGHAGLFSSARDLAGLMQCLINKGQIGTFSLFDKSIVEQYTRCQFCPGNRRAIGFDKPTVSRKDGPTCDLVSAETFGHSGFTGTITWADPTNNINYVFLSNRVYPNAENKKITSMSVRNEIQRVIYEAYFARKK